MGIAKDLALRHIEMLRQRDVSRIADLYAADGYFSMSGIRVSPVDLPKSMQEYLAAFPDLTNKVTGWVESDDGIAVEQVLTATHLGPWMTPYGELAATGKQVQWEAVEVVRVQNNKIASWYSYFDQLPAFIAVGVVPTPPTG